MMHPHVLCIHCNPISSYKVEAAALQAVLACCMPHGMGSKQYPEQQPLLSDNCYHPGKFKQCFAAARTTQAITKL